MNVMELKLVFFKLVLEYWIASHNTNFPLLADGLTYKLATYSGNKLVFKNCFKRCKNPLLVVNKNSIISYIHYDMTMRMNDFISAVIDDLQCEFLKLQERLAKIDAEAATLQVKVSECGCNIGDEARYKQLEIAYMRAQDELMKIDCILGWFKNGLPQFKHEIYSGTDFIVEFDY